MAVKALYDYNHPSRSRQELYGDDQLVHVWWVNNPFMCAAACFRAPQAMVWNDFVEQVVTPWAASDPEFQVGSFTGWTLDGEALQIDQTRTLRELGVGHKSLLAFQAPIAM
jgi:phenol hydroxylase P4 protein